MDRQRFGALLHDLLVNIFDFPLLEKHPFADLLPLQDSEINRAEALRDLVRECIELLKPVGAIPRIDDLEWRYYLILRGRYVEGLSSSDLEAKVALGERQLRRMHARAVEALESILWKKLSPRISNQPGISQNVSNPVYSIVLKPQGMMRIVEEVIDLCRPRAKAQSIEIHFQFVPNLPLVNTDRVLVRQVLLAIISYILLNKPEESIDIAINSNDNRIRIEVEATGLNDLKAQVDQTLVGKIDPYWLEQLGARLEIRHEAVMTESEIQISLLLPKANYHPILVIDDHESAIRMVQRYLTDAPFIIEGLTDPSDVMGVVRTRQPSVVMLDVMMPRMDGWEVLQALKSDPETSSIPVVVCSVWNEPEMAFSLGANGYLKKPFTQEDLLLALHHAGVLDTMVEDFPTDFGVPD